MDSDRVIDYEFQPGEPDPGTGESLKIKRTIWVTDIHGDLEWQFRHRVEHDLFDVEGKIALTFDDEIDTGGTIVNAARVLAEKGVKEVYCCVTHPVFSKNASEILANSHFKEVIVADTIPMPAEKRNGKITVLPVAPLLGEAIYRIHKGISVGDMFT